MALDIWIPDNLGVGGRSVFYLCLFGEFYWGNSRLRRALYVHSGTLPAGPDPRLMEGPKPSIQTADAGDITLPRIRFLANHSTCNHSGITFGCK